MKKKEMKMKKLLLVLVTSLLVGTVAHATSIDTTSIHVTDISSFGFPNTATYGQTFTVSGPDTILNDFSLYLNGVGSTNLRGYIAGWDGNKATSILYQSATQTTGAGNLQQFFFNTGSLNLISGNQYVAFLSISDLGQQSNSFFSMPESSNLISGQFVFINNGTDFNALTSNNWFLGYAGQNDVWFKADFNNNTPVPEPGTMALLGLGLAGLAIYNKRRNSNKA